jgi:hypothetical protein
MEMRERVRVTIKKRVFLNEPLAYWYSICKTGIWNTTEAANFNTNEKCINFSEGNLTYAETQT